MCIVSLWDWALLVCTMLCSVLAYVAFSSVLVTICQSNYLPVYTNCELWDLSHSLCFADDLSQNVFPFRRSSTNPTPKTPKLKPSTGHVAQLLAQGRMLTTELKNEPVTPIRSNSPVRRIDSPDVNSSDFHALVSPGPPDVFLLQDPAVKRSLHSQGRRKSMPTFTAYSADKKTLPQSSLVSQLGKDENRTDACMPQGILCTLLKHQWQIDLYYLQALIPTLMVVTDLIQSLEIVLCYWES